MKKSIISEIYYGMDSLSVTESMNKEQKKFISKCCEIYEKLKATLNDEQKKMLDDYVDCSEEESCVTIERNFVAGFKMGLLIGIECMDNDPTEED